MIKRLLEPLLALVGVILLTGAVLAVTVYAPTNKTVMSLKAPGTPYLVTEPGVLGLLANDVQVSAKSTDPSKPVSLVIGRSADINAWIGGSEVTRVTGASSWQSLASHTDGEAAKPGETWANPLNSDMWLVRATGSGQVNLKWGDSTRPYGLLAFTDADGGAPSLELAWKVERSSPFFWSLLILGILALLAALTSFIMRMVVRREHEKAHRVRAKRRASERARAREASRVLSKAGHDTTTMTRRQLRQLRDSGLIPVVQESVATDESYLREILAQVKDDALPMAGPARGAALIPASPRAAERRALRVDPNLGRPVGEAGSAAGAGLIPASPRAVNAVEHPQNKQSNSELIGAVENTGEEEPEVNGG